MPQFRQAFYEQRLSPRQKSLLLGSVLGDANLHKNKGNINAYLKFVHGPKQIDYLMWKSQQFKAFFRTFKPYHWDNRWGRSFQMRTRVHPEFTRMHSFLYSRPINECSGSMYPKKITEEVLSLVDPLALAIWYSDDGSLNVEKGTYRNSMTLALGGLSKQEYGLIESWFKSFLQLGTTKVMKTNCRVLRFGVEGSEVLASIIAPHIPECMKYKIKDIRLEVPHS